MAIFRHGPGHLADGLSLWVGVVMLALLSGCSGLLFYPSPTLVLSPDRIGLPYEDVTFASADGTALHGWWLPATTPGSTEALSTQPLGTVVLFHGNADNVSTHLAAVHWLPPEGFNVFLFDYRGFGRSAGTTTLDGAVADGVAALQWVWARDDGLPVAVFGQSIGGAIGVTALTRALAQASSHVSSRAGTGTVQVMVLDSTFASYRQIARDVLGRSWLTWPVQWPLSFLIPDGQSPIRYIDRLPSMPLLMVHGDADRTVPLVHGQRLYAAAQSSKTFWLVPGGRHISAFGPPDSPYRPRLVDFMRQAFAGSGP